MKNREKFMDEIVEVIKEDNLNNRKLCCFLRDNVIPRFVSEEDMEENVCGGMSCHACEAMFALWLDEEYVEPPKPEIDWDNVPVDTLVRVRDNKNDKWALRYFCEWKENGVYMTFPNGRTSKTAKYYTKEIWKYCELVEDEDE